MYRLVPTIHRLNKLTLKKIFDKLSYYEELELEDGIKLQSRRKDLPPIERAELMHIINALIRNEKGEFNKMKEKIKEHNLDYNLVYRRGI